MNEFVETLVDLRWAEPKRSYDVVIIGGGGHGLSTAYHLATRHGITDVAVLERDYIGSGNSGRNTTIIRANYGLPEAVRFYQHSLELYQRLEDETGCDVMHATKGILWLAHSVTTARTEQGRALLNTACGARTRYVEPEEIGRICPLIDLDGGGRYPIVGASYHEEGATARHDRVVWAYAQGAMRRGVDVLQGTEVTGLLRDGDRVVGVDTPQGPITAGVVLSAVGGHVTRVADWAGVRLPVRTHTLQAFVTNSFAPVLGPIVSSNDLVFYVVADRPRSDADRGRVRSAAQLPHRHDVLVPAGLRPQGHHGAPVPVPAAGAAAVVRRVRRLARLLPHPRAVRRGRVHAVDRLGHVGLQGHPGGRRGARLVDRHRDGARAHRPLRARPLRPGGGHGRSQLGGDPLMLWLSCPNCGARPVEEFRFGGELPGVPDRITDPDGRDLDYVWMLDNLDGPTVERWFHEAGCRRWHTVRRDTRTDELLGP